MTDIIFFRKKGSCPSLTSFEQRKTLPLFGNEEWRITPRDSDEDEDNKVSSSSSDLSVSSASISDIDDPTWVKDEILEKDREEYLAALRRQKRRKNRRGTRASRHNKNRKERKHKSTKDIVKFNHYSDDEDNANGFNHYSDDDKK